MFCDKCFFFWFFIRSSVVSDDGASTTLFFYLFRFLTYWCFTSLPRQTGSHKLWSYLIYYSLLDHFQRWLIVRKTILLLQARLSIWYVSRKIYLDPLPFIFDLYFCSFVWDPDSFFLYLEVPWFDGFVMMLLVLQLSDFYLSCSSYVQVF